MKPVGVYSFTTSLSLTLRPLSPYMCSTALVQPVSVTCTSGTELAGCTIGADSPHPCGLACDPHNADSVYDVWASRYLTDTGWTQAQQLSQMAEAEDSLVISSLRLAVDTGGKTMVIWTTVDGNLWISEPNE